MRCENRLSRSGISCRIFLYAVPNRIRFARPGGVGDQHGTLVYIIRPSHRSQYPRSTGPIGIFRNEGIALLVISISCACGEHPFCSVRHINQNSVVQTCGIEMPVHTQRTYPCIVLPCISRLLRYLGVCVLGGLAGSIHPVCRIGRPGLGNDFRGFLTAVIGCQCACSCSDPGSTVPAIAAILVGVAYFIVYRFDIQHPRIICPFVGNGLNFGSTGESVFLFPGAFLHAVGIGVVFYRDVIAGGIIAGVFLQRDCPVAVGPTVFLMEGLLSGRTIERPNLFGRAYPSAIGPGVFLVVGLFSCGVGPDFFGRAYPSAVGERAVILVEDRITAVVIVDSFISGRPVCAIIGCVVDLLHHSACGIVLAETLLGISQIAGGIAGIGSIFRLAPSGVIHPSILSIRRPSAVHPVIECAECLFASCESVLLFRNTFPVVGCNIPFVRSCESNISCRFLFRFRSTGTRAVRIDGPGRGTGSIAVLIDRDTLKHRVYIESLHGVNRAGGCSRKGTLARAYRVARKRRYVPLRIRINNCVDRKGIDIRGRGFFRPQGKAAKQH